MTSDLDVYRTASVLIREHGEDAALEAARRADAMLEKGAWSGPGALELHPHVLAPVASLPVREVVSAIHFITDLTLPYGEVVHDYLAG